MKTIPEMTLIEFTKHLDTLYKDMYMHQLVNLRKLRNILIESYSDANTDFNKLTIKKIEDNYPYFLLERRNASIPVFLIYKKILYPKQFDKF